LRNETQFRGKEAKNLIEEFQAYGYPFWVFKLVGAVKLSCASILVLSIMIPSKHLTLIGGCGMLVLMVVALVSHKQVEDELEKSIPAACMLGCTLLILLWQVASGEEDEEPGRVALGLTVAGVCGFMAYRSYENGDYDFSAYENAEAREPLSSYVNVDA